jgi:DNA helicase-4
MEYISSSFFGRCFGRFIGNPTLIEINSNGLTFEIKGDLTTILWEDLIVPPIFQLSFFGQIVTFITAEKKHVFTMQAYSCEYMQKANCDNFWALANIKRVENILASIKKLTEDRYLRQSYIDQINALVSAEYTRWFPWIKSSKALAKVYQKVKQLSYYQNWDQQVISEQRESYINQQLQEHKTFFDTVETNPLTPSQRRACVIDNDNNLLLAGAGTGKTSVMVGRSGYLVNSSQATHDEILLLAYGNKAAAEMDERIKDKLSTDKIKAATFHSLGLKIIAEVEGGKPSLSVFAEDEKTKFKWIQSYFEKLISESAQYRKLIVEYFSSYIELEKSYFDFKNLGEYHQYFNDNDIRTFKGEKVKSFGELYIANELFSQGIDYQYEAKYAHDVKTIERRQYQPDFFLPELNIYIEYYGIDENGDTASYIDNDEYHQGIDWKRSTHEQFNTECIELTYGQHKQGELLNSLHECLKPFLANEELTDKEIEFSPVSTEFKLATLNESGRVTELATIFGKMVGLYKSACLDETLEKKVIANSAYPTQTEKAFALLKPILEAYQLHLTSHAEIDFDDMINKALSYVQAGKFQSPWRYIMVDEFQDISEPRARLVKALRDNNQGCSVFAVGDDWQAIYRFSGADFTLTTQFANYFGPTTQSELDLTFRFNNQIGKVATDFISKNPAQINKTIKSLKQVDAPAVSLLKRDNINVNKDVTDEIANGALNDILTAISLQIDKPTSVYLLARTWALLPNKLELNKVNQQYPLLTIESQTFHASKGKEADYVVMLGMKKGKHGFPSEKVNPALLDALLAKQEDFEHAEERRLFYVALTRAKHRAYIITDMANASPFVTELINEHEIEQNEFPTTANQTYVDDINCLICETGVLKKRTGNFASFYSCSHFPRCDHKEKPCVKCESPMTRKRYLGFKYCINDICENVIPTCEKCNAEMVLRSGANGEFWGCKNYKGNEPTSCKNSINDANINWPESVT